MKDNSYLESYKIQVVRRIFAGESMKTISDELHIAKSTLWGWKCKYGSLISNEMEIENKSIVYDEFVDITLASGIKNFTSLSKTNLQIYKILVAIFCQITTRN